ncbi:DUF885 domain-containing protein [Aeromicrobium sp. IC_218]|uniref:DUF885 domain-containing protein n=1 Tax=Aeromicrobium sp. IC_218 TaxID=2545468 RepID=UPI00103C3449|nr:DUF885 domain-containing protein [Aeromicrobium sp. IC_218]TCJ00756.1 DUF885 domain-containing protein [Aeromicrobium sp. IC_218]
MPENREPTALDRVAEDWVDTVLDLQPETAVELGRPGYEGRYGDLSPEGHEAFAEAARATLATVRETPVADAVDEVTRLEMVRSLELSLEQHEAGLRQRDLNVIASPAQGVRDVFDLMPSETEQDWEQIGQRLRAVPGALEGYIASLRAGIAAGNVPAERQVRAVLAQAERHASADGFFARLASSPSAPAAMGADLDAGARAAADAYASLGRFLADELAAVAPAQDAVGRDVYALQSRYFLGAKVDLDETYEWGREELARTVAEQEAVARQIVPDATGDPVQAAVAFLDADPSRQLHGTAALQAWMQRTSDAAVEELGRTHFDVPEPVRALECMIAPTQEGGIYYTGPTEDFSRPGRMWWSVPEGVETFGTWRELTTVYHEGVPGHHLQIGVATYQASTLNSWRRMSWTSGHGEGWALYAERLMDELGYLADPADRLGMLDAQRMRAARVVLDIGVHLGKPHPDGGTWDAAKALAFMRQHVNMDDAFIRFEVDRYLGWPGQAPSYKVGQRIWEQVRDEVARREGADFDVKAFHRRALELGGLGLDTLRAVLVP